MRKFLYALAAIAVLGAALFGAAILASTTPPPIPGTLTGHRTAELEVAHRNVILPIHIWYPTAEVSGPEPELLGQNALFYGHYVLPDAPLPDSGPIAVLSHGSSGNAVQMGWLARHLATLGYMVIATNHPGTTSRDSLPARTVQIWERPADMRAMLDWLETDPLPGFRADLDDVLSVGFSLGGHSALALAGVRVSKARFIAYCAANQGKVDCGWLEDGGVDFTQIDAARYEADLSDARITRTIAIDPALPQAVFHESLTALGSSVLIVNLGAPETIPAAMRADGLAEQIAGAEFRAIDGAAHFSALPKCSALGVVMIGLTGDDNICSDQDLRPREDVHLDVLDAIDGYLARASQG